MTDTATSRFSASNRGFDLDAALRAGRDARTDALAAFLRLNLARIRRRAAPSLAPRPGPTPTAARPRRGAA